MNQELMNRAKQAAHILGIKTLATALYDFAEQEITMEREACAKEAEYYAANMGYDGTDAARAIRERSR